MSEQKQRELIAKWREEDDGVTLLAKRSRRHADELEAALTPPAPASADLSREGLMREALERIARLCARETGLAGKCQDIAINALAAAQPDKGEPK